MQKKEIKTFILLLSINFISYAMQHQVIVAISEQAQQANPSSSISSSISNILSYLTTSSSLRSTCDFPTKSPYTELSYSESYSQHLQQACTVERLSNHINDKSLQVSPDSYFYYFKVMDATIERWKRTRILFDDKQVMQELNDIEEYCKPILRQNGYITWNDKLIEALHKQNSYFNSLIDKIIGIQTSWENLKASNIDNFFKWYGKPLKKSKIGMYVHLKVMKRYAEEFGIQKYTDVKLMKHMLNRVISNVKNDRRELELLLETNSFHSVKDNEAIRKSALARIQELEKKLREDL